MFRVSAEIEGSRAYGIVTWPGSSMRELVMHFVPETVEVEIGETVVTSRFSNRFPFGIPIGEVTRIDRSQGVETQTIYIRAFADLSTLAEGFVMNLDRKSTRLNSSHVAISYAVFCLKKQILHLVIIQHE